MSNKLKGLAGGWQVVFANHEAVKQSSAKYARLDCFATARNDEDFNKVKR